MRRTDEVAKRLPPVNHTFWLTVSVRSLFSWFWFRKRSVPSDCVMRLIWWFSSGDVDRVTEGR